MDLDMEVLKLGKITAVRGDCMEYMKSLPDKCYDLAVVDPPYGINADNMQMGTHLTRSGDGYPGESTATRLKKGRLNSGGGKLKNRLLNNSDTSWDIPPTKEYFDELFRISKNQIIWGGNYFDLPPTRGIVCWDKMQPWENFSQIEYAWTSFDRPAAIYRLSNTGGANTERKIHPTQKPTKLYEWLLTKYAKQGDKILDTHGGSMSHAIACHNLGFELTIIEKDKDYFDKAIERLKWHQRQTTMFHPEIIEKKQEVQTSIF